jgi:hypothetical protein
MFLNTALLIFRMAAGLFIMHTKLLFQPETNYGPRGFSRIIMDEATVDITGVIRGYQVISPF